MSGKYDREYGQAQRRGVTSAPTSKTKANRGEQGTPPENEHYVASSNAALARALKAGDDAVESLKLLRRMVCEFAANVANERRATSRKLALSEKENVTLAGRLSNVRQELSEMKSRWHSQDMCRVPHCDRSSAGPYCNLHGGGLRPSSSVL